MLKKCKWNKHKIQFLSDNFIYSWKYVIQHKHQQLKLVKKSQQAAHLLYYIQKEILEDMRKKVIEIHQFWRVTV